MLEKLYKISVVIIAFAIVIAIVVLALPRYVADAQTTKPTLPVLSTHTPSYAQPESHVWSAVAASDRSSFLLWNKQTGETYVITGNYELITKVK